MMGDIIYVRRIQIGIFNLYRYYGVDIGVWEVIHFCKEKGRVILSSMEEFLDGGTKQVDRLFFPK